MTHLPDILGLWSLPLASEAALLLLLCLIEVAQGMKHGYFYSVRDSLQDRLRYYKQQLPDHSEAARAFDEADDRATQAFVNKQLELHYVDRRMMWVFYALLVVGGVDLVRVLCAQSVARPLFQLYINWGAGNDAFRELDSYSEYRDGEWHKIAKGAIGRDRLWVAALNLLVCLFYAPLLHALFNLFGIASAMSFLT